MPSERLYSPAARAAARGGPGPQVFCGNSAPLERLAADSAAALDAYLASPEFARQQAAQHELLRDLHAKSDAMLRTLTDQAPVMPRDQGESILRGESKEPT
jgi:hypothetical protein